MKNVTVETLTGIKEVKVSVTPPNTYDKWCRSRKRQGSRNTSNGKGLQSKQVDIAKSLQGAAKSMTKKRKDDNKKRRKRYAKKIKGETGRTVRKYKRAKKGA
jgi:hypothetical protein